MNKTHIISLTGMLTLLLLQGYWLNNSYSNEKKQYSQTKQTVQSIY